MSDTEHATHMKTSRIVSLLLRAAGQHQNALCPVLNCSEGVISKKMNGHQKWAWDDGPLLAEHFNVGIGTLFRDPDDLAGHFDTVRVRVGPESFATELSHVRGFYKWAVIHDHLPTDPTVKLVRPRLPRKVPRPFTTGDLIVAIDLAPERVRPWLLLGSYAGLRAVDMCGLRAEHVNGSIFVAGKGGHERHAPLSPQLAAELQTCGLPTRGWLFPRRDGDPGHVPPHIVSHLTNRYLHSIGIDSTLHQARHWFGTEFYRATKDIRATQEAMGHASLLSTMLYTKIVNDAVAEGAASLPVLR